MKQLLLTILAILFLSSTFSQQIISGDYDSGLKLSYDSTTKKATGYFENYTGLDEQTKNPKFSCIFYIEGIVTGQKFKVNTYFPTDKKDDIIQGTIEIVSNEKLKIRLPKEHGGCWNVQHFADEPAEFKLEKNHRWIQVRYVDTTKTYFYDSKSGNHRLKAYLVKGNFVCIEKIEKDWAYCTYFGKKATSGWLRIRDLN